MAHSIPKTIQLNHKFNKVIRKGKPRKFVVTSGESDTRDRSLRVWIDGRWLDKPIQVYRMWFRFLQLALELEEQKVQIISKLVRTKLDKPVKDKWGHVQKFAMVPIVHKVKVNRKKYKGWDIDSIPTSTFNDWWFGNKGHSPHREMFLPDSSIAVLKNKDDWIDDKRYTYIRIDNRRRANEIDKDIRNFFAQQKEKGKLPEVNSTSDFPITGNPNINGLINQYNAAILKLSTEMRDAEIMAMDIFRPVKSSDAGESAFLNRQTDGRAMMDLMRPAKIALLSVCDGHFPNHPTKDFF